MKGGGSGVRTGGGGSRGGRVLGMLGSLLVIGALAVFAQELLPLPDPDLSRLESGVQEKLHDAREALLVAIGEGEGSGDADQDRRKKGRLYGHTGKVFHAHNAYAVAEVCYRNAAVLEPDEVRWPYTLGFLYQPARDSATSRKSLNIKGF